jgi:hypothetical protein
MTSEPTTQTTCAACEITDELNTCFMCDAPVCDDHTLWDDDDDAYCTGCADRIMRAAAAQALGVLADLARQHEAGTLTLAGFSATLGSLNAADLDNIAEYLA